MKLLNNKEQQIEDSIRDALDKRVKATLKRMVKMDTRGDKSENRVLVFSQHRLYIFTAKVPSRMENNFHFLDIQGIESKKTNQMTVTIDGKSYVFSSIEPMSDEMDHIITHIGISLKQIFPAFPLERLIIKLDVQPSDRLKTMYDMIHNLESKDPGPCGGFTAMYNCMCDYHNLPIRDEVSWDVDTIYLSHDTRILRLQDFDHLLGKDLVPIIGALEHNTWFKGINASNVKLTVEACNELVKVMRRNSVIEEVNLSNTGIKVEFLQKFSTAVISNGGTQLSNIDLSNNLLEDKGVTHLFGAIKTLPCGLSHFDLSRTGISSRCLNKVGEVLSQSPNVLASLSTLKLNDNGFKGEDFPMLYTCLAQPSAISYLDLSFTDCALDSLCDPLLRGCPNLSTLRASRCVFSHKRSKDVVVPQSWKMLFASICCLEYLDLSSCKLPPEAFKDMLLGLSSNRNIKALYADLSSNDFGTAGSYVMASCIAAMTNISGLDLSNNGFDLDIRTLLPELAKNTSLKQLSIGRNFANIKPKHMQEVMNALVSLIQEDESNLESLSLADSKLKTDTTYVINALGSNNTLQEIDLSGNLLGDVGARLLAKALLINTRLRKVVWDRNNISAQGYEDVAEALTKNLTLRKMPFPVNDAAVALRMVPDRTEVALQKIESLLQRNHSPHRFASDQAYRLQQGFLISSTQQMVDRLTVQVQDTVNALRSLGTLDVFASDLDSAEKLVSDANNSRQLLPGLQDIALKSQASGNPVDVQLQQMADRLRQAIEEQNLKTTEKMLKCASNHCPALMKNESFQASIKEGCQSKSSLPKDFTKGILEGPSTDIHNTTSEMNLEMAALISDSVVDEVIESLSSTHKTLTNHLNLRKSGHYKEKSIKEKAEETEASKTKSSAEASSKRKSLLNRRTRPQSTLDRESRTSVIKEEDDVEDDSPLYQNYLLAAGDEVLVAAAGKSIEEKAAELSKLDEKSNESTPLGSVEQLDGFGELPVMSSRPLEHVTKARPRREKAHRPTRPVLATGSTSLDEGPDNNKNHAATAAAPAPAPTVTLPSKGKEETTASTSQKSEPAKPEETSVKSEGKKWSPMSLIKGKNKEEKSEKESKKSQSFSSSFSSIFKKKDDKKRTGSESSAPKAEPVPEQPAEPLAPIKDIQEERSMSLKEGRKLSCDQPPPEAVREVEQAAPLVAPPRNTSKAAASAVVADAEEKPADRPLKVPREKPNPDRPALLPPSRVVEPKAPTLATEEDTSLDGENKVAENRKSGGVEEESEKPDTVPKLPAGLAKVGGLGALGGRNLLQEMKQRQEKRFSKVETSPQEESKEPVPDSPKSPETNNNISGSTQKSEPGEKSRSAVPSKPLPLKPEVVKKEPAADQQTPPEPVAATPSPPPKPASSPTLSATKVPSVAAPAPAPRVLLPPKRPLSTVETKPRQSMEIPRSMTTSTPEVLLDDSAPSSSKDTAAAPVPAARPRPPPPIKPRPPVLPRPRKQDVEDTTAPKPSAPGSEVTSPTSPKPDSALPELKKEAPEVKKEAPEVKKEAPEVKKEDNVTPTPPPVSQPSDTPPEVTGNTAASDSSPSDAPDDSGIVYDSATLRLSVKDKIKRLRQSQVLPPTAGSDSSAAVQLAKQKAMSLPKDAKLPDTIPEDSNSSENDSSPVTKERSSPISEEDDSIDSGEPQQQAPAIVAPEDEIMV
ncbi:F-actin-uncapping protein LRRC16A [Aplysia californica]|uniref:F-actin-uncapping protein LRRC16A n=1 Tax=Aplysia californica TaxID=6500 RepID=A0ABM1VWT1_APLCA|nr:F-actin-uncapping protein LRRC16A [Aplysia californica]